MISFRGNNVRQTDRDDRLRNSFRIIQGFVSRGRTSAALHKCDLPAMLIRFSDNHPGHLTVSYGSSELRT